MRHSVPASDGLWLDAEAGPVVRPYAMTHGRTRPSHGDFDLITIVVAAPQAMPADAGFGPEHRAIVQRCQRPLSVAEIASQLDLPVGTVRVLLGDLLDARLIRVRPPSTSTSLPSDHVFKAVLDGLRAL
jgi:hypothetical protein